MIDLQNQNYPIAAPLDANFGPSAQYEADIAEHGGGRFIASCRAISLIVIHADPERQFAHELTLRGVPDGPIQFHRSDHGGMASISFKSIYRAARHRTHLGDQFPKLAKRQPPMSEEAKARLQREGAQDRHGSRQDGSSQAPGISPGPLTEAGLYAAAVADMVT